MSETRKCCADKKTGMVKSGFVDPKDIQAVIDSECRKPAKFQVTPVGPAQQYGSTTKTFYVCEEHVTPFRSIDELEVRSVS